MRVNLIDYTGMGMDPWHAADVMIFTKNTRIKMGPDGMTAIKAWPEEKKRAELHYMANTIRSSWEFCEYTFMIEDVTRALTHQFVRSRHASFAQQTMQILDVRGFTVEKPDFTKEYGDKLAVDAPYVDSDRSEEMNKVWDDAIEAIRRGYDRLIEIGATVEEARGLLPTNIHTNIVCKMNLRTLVDFINSRISTRNLKEITKMVKLMRAEILRVHPWATVFFDQTIDKILDQMSEKVQLLKNGRQHGDDLFELGTLLLKDVDQIRRAKG